MALRVTQGMMYGASVQGMNKTLAAYMESNLQSSSQKKINRPSDNPTGAAQVIASRNQLNTLVRYQSNINMANGWLSTIDYNLVGNSQGSVQAILTAIKGLDLQGSTGTVGEDNRHQIASSLREYYQQLLTMANESFNGSYVFGGHKTDTPPYAQGMAVDCLDPNNGAANSVGSGYFHVEGSSAYTVLIQAVGGGAPGTQVDAKDAAYRYSDDGGKTWNDCVVTPGQPSNQDKTGTGTPQCIIQAGGVSVAISDETKQVTIVDPANEHSKDNGTWLYVRPTAIYQGDDHDTQVVASYGATASGTAEGNFVRDVAVRIDDVSGGFITYSYSLDDGSNWTQTKAPAVLSGVPPTYNLPVPGGYLNLDALPTAGNQFNIHPHHADINLQISDTSSITINMVGKDVFGGLYNYPGDGIKNPVPVTGQANLFEVIGRLIGFAETNSQDGFQRAMDEVSEVMSVIVTKGAVAGGREDRLMASSSGITGQIYNEEERLSTVEDVDVTELMTRLAQQQMAYNSVLKSSSMIMQMSLVNFL